MPASEQQKRKKNDGGQNIKVFIRVRPMNGSEKSAKNFCCVQCQNNKEIVIQERLKDKYSKKFSFDKVFPECSKQLEIFKTVAKPLVEEVFNGFNCTIFAYGQTGTGKTYTMEGEHANLETNFEENAYAGIVPRCVNYLFDELRIQQMEFTMRVSFLELYNEELFDLLSAQDDLTKLRLYEDATRKGSCIIQGLEEVLVRSKMDVYNIIKKGSAKRQTAATLMNATSSRSHTVFTVTVHIKETTPDGNEMLKTGKLHLVDLAGSENIGRSGAVDKRAREAGNINQSLLTVGRVISSLVEKAPHIPYRESKLTRLLQDALGGRTKTSIIATISPASINLEETLSTLEYAYRAKNIQNRPEANQKLNKKELITEYTAEIDRLQRDLLATRERNGVFLANENYQDMIFTIEEQTKELLDKINYIRVIEEEREKLKETFNEVSAQLKETSSKLVQSEAVLTETKETLQCTQKLLVITANERSEESYLKTAHMTTEDKLFDHSKDLISVADVTTSDIGKLHCKIDRKSKVEDDNKEIGDNFALYFEDKTNFLCNNFQQLLEFMTVSSKKNVFKLGSIVKQSDDNMGEMIASFNDLSTYTTSSLAEMTKFLYNKDKKNNEDVVKYCSKMADDVSTIEKDCQQMLQEKVMPFMTSLVSLVVSMDGMFTSLKEENARKLAEIEKCCELSLREQISSLKIIQSHVQSLLDAHQDGSRSQEHTMKILKDRKDEHIKELKRIAEAALAAVEEENKTYEHYADINLMREEVDEKLKGHYTKISTTETKMETDIPQNQANIKHLIEETNLPNICSEYYERSNALKSEQTAVCDDLKAHNIKRADAFEDLQNNASDFKQMLCESMTSCHTGLAESVETLSVGLTDDLNKKKLSLEAQHLSRVDELDSVCGDMEHTLDEVGASYSDQESLLQKCSRKVTDLFKNRMKKDVPTGETPVRKTYAFSRILAQTSPHHKLLQRFRGRNSTSNVPVPDTELEDSLPSSINHDSDSCNEATSEVERPEFRRSGSFKEPPTFTFARTTSNIDKEVKPCRLAKSSSVSCIEELKENKYGVKKRELRAPSTVTSQNAAKLRPRKVLGPLN